MRPHFGELLMAPCHRGADASVGAEIMLSTRCFPRLSALLLGLALCACSPKPFNEPPKLPPDQQVIDNTPSLAWRATPECLQSAPWAKADDTRTQLTETCPLDNKDLITLSLSGGGTKAAVFAGEVMFYLDAVGLLSHASMVSSVSGGSFAAAYYALSCDEQDDICQSKMTKSGVSRPVWRYPDSMNTIGYGFEAPMIEGLLRIAVTPFGDDPASPDDFAAFVDEHYLHGPDIPNKGPYLFSDLNPRRPQLILNSTLLSDVRTTLDSQESKGFQRRRNADEFLHFAFNDFYFRQIGSDLANFPLGYGVTASGAFPVLIGSPVLRNYAYCDADERRGGNKIKCLTYDHNWLVLSDGGSNDNQGLIEVFTTLAELANGEKRSEYSAAHPCPLRPAVEGSDRNRYCMEDGDRALILIVNSSITEATGPDAPPNGSFFPAPFLTLYRTLERTSDAIDVYSAAGYNLRKRLYQSDLEDLSKAIHTQDAARDITLTPVEIGLVTLNDYPQGGAETAYLNHTLSSKGEALPPPNRLDRNAQYITGVDRRGMANCGPEPGANRSCQTLADRQRSSFRQMTASVRRSLALNDIHPQCLFEQSKLVETGLLSLASMSDHNGACLRHAARWAAALRGEEMCRQMDPANIEEYGYYPLLSDKDGKTALRCDAHHHLASLGFDFLHAFETLPACEISKDSEDDRIAVQSALNRNFAFVEEVRENMTHYKDKWERRWRTLAEGSNRPVPVKAEDFVSNYPLDQVCNMGLYEPDLREESEAK